MKPDYAEAYYNRGMALLELKRHDEALASYNKAVELKPGIDFLIGYRLHTKLFVCDWRNLNQEIQELRLQIEKSKTASNPFILLGLVDSAPLQRKCAEIFTKEKFSSLQWGLLLLFRAVSIGLQLAIFQPTFTIMPPHTSWLNFLSGMTMIGSEWSRSLLDLTTKAKCVNALSLILKHSMMWG